MGYWELRRLLRAIERAADRWRLHEAWWNPDPIDWRATVDDSDTGRWYTLGHFTDLVVRHPVLPPGQPPQPHPWWRHDAPHDSGDLTLGELLAVVDGVAAAYPRYKLIHLQRTERDLECYQVYVIEERALTRDPSKPLLSPENWPYRGHWLDTPADWARLRGGGVVGE